ncbi:hypothetical protein [Paraburkholderia sp. BR14320]|uniref:hypothetical protein n=1 Tax=unclassified Paraburkholderia TaxID=2615204 RepID=UPI0034CFD62B
MPTRLLTVNLPRLLSDLVVGLVADEDDLMVVGDVAAGLALTALEAIAPEVVVVCMDKTERAHTALAQLRERRPPVRIVELHDVGRTAIIHVPGALPRMVADVSPGALLRMLRGPGN